LAERETPPGAQELGEVVHAVDRIGKMMDRIDAPNKIEARRRHRGIEQIGLIDLDRRRSMASGSSHMRGRDVDPYHSSR
jgi:hypothetical protein